MTIELNIPIRAIPHQSVRMTRSGHAYQPKKITDYKDEIREIVGQQLPDDFVIIANGTPIKIERLHYYFEIPKSWSKKKKAETKFMVNKPDLHDNLNKALFDALEGLVWESDHNICEMTDLRKSYADNNYIVIVIKTLC